MTRKSRRKPLESLKTDSETAAEGRASAEASEGGGGTRLSRLQPRPAFHLIEQPIHGT